MHPLLEQYQHTLLGRLRTKLFEEISGSVDRLPSDRQLWRYLMYTWKQNALLGSLYFHLLHLKGSRRIDFPLHLSRQLVRAHLRDIAKRPPISGLFAEADSYGGDTSVGCLAFGHTRPSGEPGYYAAIMSEKSFPNFGFVSIAPSIKGSDSLVAQLRPGGWDELTVSKAGTQQGPCIALTAIHRHLSGLVTMPIDEIQSLPGDQPPLDPECVRRIQLVLRGRMRVAKATVARDLVQVFDRRFTDALDPEKTKKLLKHANNGLLVYWNGEHLISSDDYYAFRGCELLGLNELNVVIMGRFPEKLAKVSRWGDHKLMPPPLVVTGESFTPGETVEFKEWKAREKALMKERLHRPSDMLAHWIALADLLGDPDPSEQSLHKFLTSFPIILGAKWDVVESEVRFGAAYIADLVLRANRALPTVQLVELERPSHRLFTKDLRETAKVTHSVQQVTDWLRYCRQHPEDPVVAGSKAVSPDGLVVIGRSRYLTQKEREVLSHNNQGRDVKVITYDELLDDFGTLILKRLDDGNARVED